MSTPFHSQRHFPLYFVQRFAEEGNTMCACSFASSHFIYKRLHFTLQAARLFKSVSTRSRCQDLKKGLKLRKKGGLQLS